MQFLTHTTLISLSVATLAVSAPQTSGQATAEISIQHSTIPAGGSSYVALHLIPNNGWHTYWKNPGEMGMATSISWTLPDGITIAPLEFPAPHTFTSSGIISLGYDHDVTLIAKLSVADTVKPGKVTLTGAASWLTCTSEACVPGDIKADLTLEITKEGTTATASSSAEAITRAQEVLPLPGKDWKAHFHKKTDTIRLSIQPPAGITITADSLAAYIATPGVVALQLKQTWQREGDAWVTHFPVSEYLEKLPPVLDLVLTGGGLTRAVEISTRKSE